MGALKFLTTVALLICTSNSANAACTLVRNQHTGSISVQGGPTTLTSCPMKDIRGNGARVFWANTGTLTQLEDDIFTNLAIQQLTIADNPLGELNGKAFRGMRQLRGLYASNSISALRPEDFEYLGKLGYAYFHENRLVTLPKDVFRHLTEVKSIFLWSNELSSLPDTLFGGKSQIQFIDLSSNNLTTIPDSLLHELAPTLNEIHLRENNFSETERVKIRRILSTTTVEF